MTDSVYITTPVGIAGYNTVTSKGDDGFTLNLFFDSGSDEVQSFINEVNLVHKNFMGSLEDKKGRETFTIRKVSGSEVHEAMKKYLNADKEYYMLKTSSKFRPKLFDSSGEETTLSSFIGQGSLLLARLGLRAYTTATMHGTKIDLNGVQISELAETTSKKGTMSAIEGSFKGVSADTSLD